MSKRAILENDLGSDPKRQKILHSSNGSYSKEKDGNNTESFHSKNSRIFLIKLQEPNSYKICQKKYDSNWRKCTYRI